MFEVIPTEIFRAGSGALTYSSDLPLQPGHLVLIPLGQRIVPGIVLKKVPPVSFPTKAIISLLHPNPLPLHLLHSIQWLSQYYLSPLPTTASLALPKGLPGLRKAPSAGHGLAVRARMVTRSTASPCPADGAIMDRRIPLNRAQTAALTALEAQEGTSLLRGVTGSGKTNIYLKLALNALEAHSSTILLVPEIALTSQLVQIFRQTFGDRVVLIHSRQTVVERRTTWLKIHESPDPLVIIGPRSALLAPVHDLGLIIIDEAHEAAYFQENSPRYSALRLASFIASQAKIKCVLGSATPNVVDYHLASLKHSLVDLPERAKTTAKDPEITLVDLKNRDQFPRNRYFSTPLLNAIQANLEQGYQTLIFHNRRGSAPLTICENCGWQALCPNCYLPMILHADHYELCCHLCGHTETVPTSCPNCAHAGIIHKGYGTKLLESELSRLFPEAHTARFDGDNHKNQDLSSLYDDVKSGAIQILIGTQTLAKGLDLPRLATVGIVQADAGLSLPDFAAEERTFELLTQVIGRVGRGHLDTASVIVQTFQPHHPVIETALKADFPAFADYLLKQRQKSHLPPFAHLAKLSTTFKTEKTVIKKIQDAYHALSTTPGLEVSPPLPAFHEHGARGYTWQIILKSRSRTTLLSALAPFAEQNGFSLTLDPPSLL